MPGGLKWNVAGMHFPRQCLRRFPGRRSIQRGFRCNLSRAIRHGQDSFFEKLEVLRGLMRLLHEDPKNGDAEFKTAASPPPRVWPPAADEAL